jgi:hypothetical protein
MPQLLPRVSLVLALLAAVPLGADEGREADHAELRRMLVTVRDAINSQHLEAMEPLLASHFSMVLVDGQLISDVATLKVYYARLLDPQQGVVRSLKIDPSADALTEFLAPDVGVCHGTSSDTFVLRGGVTRVLRSRWTATLVKTGGTWKIAAVHVGANLLDNPILDEHKSVIKTLGLGGAAACLVLALAGFAVGRRTARR